MATISQRITNCLWYDNQAEAAAKLYTSVFKNSNIGHVSRYGKEGYEFHHQPEGSVSTVTFYLDGQEFLGLNAGPAFKFTEAISLMINCDGQEEIDYYWNKLTEGGEEGPCGWLKDKFGLSWQVVPVQLIEMLKDPDPVKTSRVTAAYLRMQKFDLKKLQQAFTGH